MSVHISRLKAAKAFRAITVLASLVGLSLHIGFILKSYWQYNFTEVTYERRGHMRFPEVSICNLRGISSSNFEAAAETSPKVSTILSMLNMSQSTGAGFSLRDFAEFAGQDVKLMGHKLKDMILDCMFEKEPCKKEDFEHFLFPSFVNCYTFTKGRHSFLTSKGGIATGLNIIVYLEPEKQSLVSVYNNKNTFSHSTGVKVLLTPPNHLRTISFSSYDAAPGFSTSLVFDTIKHKRLPEPYNQCSHSTSKSGETSTPYSFAECRNDCIHVDVIDVCGCHSTEYLVRNPSNISSCGQFLLVNKTVSDSLLECQHKVIAKATQTPNYFQRKCKCFSPCSDTRYSVTISHANWPAKYSTEDFLQGLLEDNPFHKELKAHKYYQQLKSSNATEEQIYSWVSDHFLMLNVYARTDMVKVKTEIPMYTLTNLMSSFGGGLGLWVGVSFLTFSKLFDFLVGLTVRVEPTETN